MTKCRGGALYKIPKGKEVKVMLGFGRVVILTVVALAIRLAAYWTAVLF